MNGRAYRIGSQGKMQIDPIATSIVAFIVSIISVGYSLYTGSVNRRLQVEQIKLDIQKSLFQSTFKTLDLVNSILKEKEAQQVILAASVLTDFSQDIYNIWYRTFNLKLPWIVPSGFFAVSFQQNSLVLLNVV